MDYRYIPSPIGRLLLAGDSKGLSYIGFPEGRGQLAIAPHWQLSKHCFSEAEQQLQQYFAGERRQFDLTLAPTGTDFQLEVLAALEEIPCGQTRSYADIAQRIGRPRAVRAVGAANGRNPLPIVIPCHRVIGKDGSLTGFGGGLPTKIFLLTLEGSLPQQHPQQSLL